MMNQRTQNEYEFSLKMAKMYRLRIKNPQPVHYRLKCTG